MKKRDILFLCQFFYPEHNSSATLPFDTAGRLAGCGYTVDALCGYPKEYAADRPFPKKETVAGIGIRRLKYLQLSRVGILGRLINYFSFTFAVLLRVLSFRKYRSVIVYSNPPVLPIAPILANLLFHTKIVFVAYDVYPEVAYASGTLKNGDIIDCVMKRINRSLYRRADAVVALTEEMKQFISDNRPEIDDERIAVIPNWAHEKYKKASPEDYTAFGYRENQLIVSYFGNMGTCQDMETLLGAMKLLKDENNIQFLIVGHGNKKPYVEEQTADLPNVKVYSFLTGKDFEQASAITDVGIVSLEPGLKGVCAPSKYYSYLQAGSAVITITEADSYLALELAGENIGIPVINGDSQKLAEALIHLQQNPQELATMRSNAFRLYQERYAIDKAMTSYEALFCRLLGDTVKG